MSAAQQKRNKDLAVQLARAEDKARWAMRRLELLLAEQRRFRDPERTILCDIIANGALLPDPDGKRYGVQQ